MFLFLLLIAVTLYSGYQIGVSSPYRYTYVLILIYTNVCCMLWIIAQNHYAAAVIHLPLAIFIALIALYLSDLVIPTNLAYKKSEDFTGQAVKKLILGLSAKSSISSPLAITSDDFSQLNFFITEAKSQLQSKKYNELIALTENLRRFILKLEKIQEKWLELDSVERVEIKTVFIQMSEDLRIVYEQRKDVP